MIRVIGLCLLALGCTKTIIVELPADTPEEETCNVPCPNQTQTLLDPNGESVSYVIWTTNQFCECARCDASHFQLVQLGGAEAAAKAACRAAGWPLQDATVQGSCTASGC